MRFHTTVAAVVAAFAFTVTGCASSEPEPKFAASKPYNDADVTFATAMMQHHAQALQMVDLTLGRNLDPQIAGLAEEIRSAQTPEIETMVGLLDKWDHQPIPATNRDHSSEHGGGAEMDTSMPGMATAKDMAALEAATGAGFEAKWLSMMIEHHQGAIEMATTEADDGEDTKAVALADDIVESQDAQVKTMQGLLNQ